MKYHAYMFARLLALIAALAFALPAFADGGGLSVAYTTQF